MIVFFSAPAGVFNATDSLENPAVCGPEQRSMAQKTDSADNVKLGRQRSHGRLRSDRVLREWLCPA